MFENQTFLVAADVLPSTVQVLERCGGTVVYRFNAEVTCGVAADVVDRTSPRPPLEAQIPSARCFRALRLPVVYETWVHACVAAQTQLPCRNLSALDTYFATSVVVGRACSGECENDAGEAADAVAAQQHQDTEQAALWRRAVYETLEGVCGLSRVTAACGLVAYDPLVFDGVQFTTTQLPKHMKANVIAALQFLGGSYSPHLTTRTRLVVYGGAVGSVRPSASPSPSWPLEAHASEAAISSACERQTSGGRLPSPSASSVSSAAGGRETQSAVREDDDHTSQQAVAVVRKLSVARSLNLPCVTPSWVQQCLRDGCFAPLQTTHCNAHKPISPSLAPLDGSSALHAYRKRARVTNS